MASYNWDQVKKAISDNGLVFSDADLALAQKNHDAGMSLVNYKLDYANATTDDQKALAHAGAEKIRSDYGRYTGGADGSKFYVNEPSPMSFEYGNAGKQSSAGQTSEFKNPYADQTKAALDKVMNQQAWENPYAVDQKTAYETVMNQQAWENPYSDQQKAALDAVTNREAFSYDPTQDVAWQSARKQYLRESDRAQQDMLGQAAGLTGGMPSTAAMTAASQAGDYYRGQLNDRMADYQNMAYDRYLNDANLDFNTLDAINNMSESDYAKYMDLVNNNYNKLNAANQMSESDYAKYMDLVNNNYNKLNTANQMSESDYQKYVDALGMDFDRLSAINSMKQQARDEFDTDRNFGYNQWTDELGFQSDKQQTKYEQEQYAREYADSSNDNLAKLYLSLYDSTLNSKYLDMALERIAQIGK